MIALAMIAPAGCGGGEDERPARAPMAVPPPAAQTQPPTVAAPTTKPSPPAAAKLQTRARKTSTSARLSLDGVRRELIGICVPTRQRAVAIVAGMDRSQPVAAMVELRRVWLGAERRLHRVRPAGHRRDAARAWRDVQRGWRAAARRLNVAVAEDRSRDFEAGAAALADFRRVVNLRIAPAALRLGVRSCRT
ncbi:MAG TPA: hypothetical protein VJT75_08335 [Thermoleophilaceae bacterium]|nr:hypothetical protein [Thermoleophilaceae bacterium]